MWPTAHTFRRGHRIRVQVSSGAHPLFARNLGTGDPLGTGTAWRAAEQEVLHDPEHLSRIELPLRRAQVIIAQPFWPSTLATQKPWSHSLGLLGGGGVSFDGAGAGTMLAHFHRPS